MSVIVLKPGKERSLLRRHPWIYDSAIAKGNAAAGQTVRVHAQDGRFLAWAAYSPTSKIRARVWSFEENDVIDEAFFTQRLQAAWAMRKSLHLSSNAFRWIHGESDGLPGLIVDVYGSTLVAQFLSAGVHFHQALLVRLLSQIAQVDRIYERSDSGVRQLEGLEPVKGWLLGSGETEFILNEHQWKLSLDFAQGHKTGFYLDQRQSRHHFACQAVQHQWTRMLNCFCYTGGFSIAAIESLQRHQQLTKESHIISIDSSKPALERAHYNAQLNGLPDQVMQWHHGDVNTALRQFIQEGRQFDAIVLDPPKFAPSAAHANRAARAYKDINRLAFLLLAPGGRLYTYSCSGGIGVELFHQIVASAAHEAKVIAYILDRFGGDYDHPMTTAFPEGEYLKGLLLARQ